MIARPDLPVVQLGICVVSGNDFDLQRTIWDPEYRRRVIDMLKNTGANSNEPPPAPAAPVDQPKITGAGGKSGAD